MTAQTFGRVIAILEAVYGEAFSDQERDAWWWALTDLGDSAMLFALRIVLQHVRFKPKPADLFLRAQEYAPPPAPLDSPALGPGDGMATPEVARQYIEQIRETLRNAKGPMGKTLQGEILTLNESDVARLRQGAADAESPGPQLAVSPDTPGGQAR